MLSQKRDERDLLWNSILTIDCRARAILPLFERTEEKKSFARPNFKAFESSVEGQL